MEELIDIYTADRTLTGKVVARDDAFLKEGEYMLYVLAVVLDLEGRYLVVQRAKDKRWAPGKWEVVGGGVSAGESSEQAVVREVSEEVGLDVSDQPLDLVFTYENVDLERGDNYIVDIYRFQFDVAGCDVVLQESEAADYMLATWEEICELAKRDEFLHFERLRSALGK